MSVTINTPATAFVSKASEVAFIENALLIAATEIRRGTGAVTSGTIVGAVPNATATASLGSWTYTPSATGP
jgi:hypothetical protein